MRQMIIIQTHSSRLKVYLLLRAALGLQIVHRDIKLENIMMSEGRVAKLGDFGLATPTTPGCKLKQFCGSPSYAAPEICSRRYIHNSLISSCAVPYVYNFGIQNDGLSLSHNPYE